MSETIDQKVIVPAIASVRANNGVPTQVANPQRASWRTYVQAVVGFLIGANVVLPIVALWLTTEQDGLAATLGPAYPIILAGVNFGILVLGLLSKLIAQLMAHPAVNGWIVQHLSWLAPIKPIA